MGSAKHGVGHFIGQRVSAVILVVLVLWSVGQALGLARAGYDGASLWLSTPFNAVPVGLLIAVGAYHMQLGMRTIIEDYIHGALPKQALLLASQLICWGVTVVGVVSILKVALGGGAH
jgi:succinate dehydrogenase / fumarate reductase membrane anchor subunit